jgi:hypothetical protein
MKYYPPIRNYTGAVHAQPAPEHLHIPAWAFTADFAFGVDMRGALDAPEAIPAGSLRVLDFERLSLVVGHVYRPGWRT